MREALSYPVFRRIWGASLFSNFGQLIQSVGAAWAMTELTGKADMVALVQTATFLPMMLFALYAGAIADTYDRRKVAMLAIGIALVSAAAMTVTARLGLLAPNLILVFTFFIGTGIALFGPSWQASVSEQVPSASVPGAISLNSISYNIARSFGPAIGGVIVAVAGAAAAFFVNAVFFLPMLIVLFLWKRDQEPSRLPPERLNRAVVSGVRYVIHSPKIRVVIIRTIITGTLGCAFQALMPLVARDLLHGDARTYGLLLGAFGIGAVTGAFAMNGLRERFTYETLVQATSLTLGIAMLGVAVSPWTLLTVAALVVGGASWMISVTIYNISVQTVLPRWVSGRALAAYQTAIAGGMATGAWVWGHVAQAFGVSVGLSVAGFGCMLSAGAAIWLRLPHATDPAEDRAKMLAEPQVDLELTPRSGPIVVEILYTVPRFRARAFYSIMQEIQLIRQRNGGYSWSLARDIGNPELWTERFHCPTWLDYLRQRSRPTQSEHEMLERANAFHEGESPPLIRRMLDRPFGSVRWREDVRENAVAAVPPGPAAP
ncbi:MFS transporter [Sphingobium sp. DEHP117]|uniref:MFS transporter n=1 Tax=Sphingobium sp. DEHP117 TaxID=2993436 RepID=UPI0027D5EFFA|nr:MFS transporter [Sphingobium sp. DEHP117]MDQ4419499.1 MFS transporter [Sphingobium sp. DEHP117]